MNTRACLLIPGLLIWALAATPGTALEGSFAPLPTTTTVEPAILVNSTNTPGTSISQFKIVNPGSYYLAANISGSGGKYGIEIAASDVTLDLRGFRMVVAAGQTAASALWASLNGAHDIVIRNGIVDSWKGYGLDLSKAANTIVENMLVSGCSKGGFNMGPDATVRLCRARGSGFWGFYFAGAGTLTQCTATNSVNTGIYATSSCIISECQAMQNGAHGIYAGPGGVVTRCSSRLNKGHGIYANGASTMDCRVADNVLDGIYADAAVIRGCSSSTNKGCGIQVVNNCMVENNHCVSNTGAGIRVKYTLNSTTGGGYGNRVEHNQVSSNGIGLDAWKPCTDNLFINNFSTRTFLANFVDPDENITPPAVKYSTELPTKNNDALFYMPEYTP